MKGYTKLFGSIIASTIWREDDKTRIVWITMLAMANQHGDVEGSIPGLADMARVSITDVEAALVNLKAPDPYSRTKDHEGRRIEEIDGGWHILNHGKYREKMNKDERREYLRRKQQERRERLKAVNNPSTNVAVCNETSTPSTQAEAEAEADQSNNRLRPPSKADVLAYATNGSTVPITADCALRWLTDRETSEWMRPKGLHMLPVLPNWQADLRGYAMDWNKREDERRAGRSRPPNGTPAPTKPAFDMSTIPQL